MGTQLTKFLGDYKKVIKVLNSCVTESQVKTSDKFFELFMNKWSEHVFVENRLKLVSMYHRVKNQKMLSLYKNKHVKV